MVACAAPFLRVHPCCCSMQGERDFRGNLPIIGVGIEKAHIRRARYFPIAAAPAADCRRMI